MNFGMIILNQGMEIKHNYITLILIVSLFILNEKDERLLSISKNKKVISLFKEKLGERIRKEFVALRAKTYAYLMEDGS